MSDEFPGGGPRHSKLAELLLSTAIGRPRQVSAWDDFAATSFSNRAAAAPSTYPIIFMLKLELGAQYMIASPDADPREHEHARRDITLRIVHAVFGDFRDVLHKAMISAHQGSRRDVLDRLHEIETRMFGVP